jgi:hypothetical protein
MPKMLKSLQDHPEKGLLGAKSMVYWRRAGVIQYWRSFDDLENFARNPSEPHLEAWRRFNRAVGSGRAGGVWHETYMVRPQEFECIYVNMPKMGALAQRQRSSQRSATARQPGCASAVARASLPSNLRLILLLRLRLLHHHQRRPLARVKEKEGKAITRLCLVPCN